MINKVILTGRLTQDVELRRTGDGTPYTFFTLAVNTGKDSVDFVPCTAWRQTADLMEQYLSKGSLIGVEGQLKVFSQQKDGAYETRVNVNVGHVVFLESRAMQDGATTQSPAPQTNVGQAPQTGFAQNQTVNPQDINLEEIKF